MSLIRRKKILSFLGKTLSVLGLSLVLISCSNSLPDYSRKISSFVPDLEKTDSLNYSDFQWAKEKYPNECRWEKLVRIIDGDTIVTEKSGKIRLIGIDTPEIKSPFTEEEPGGKEATVKIREILADSEKVCLIHDEIGDQTDKYGRSLDYVFSENGLDINAEMLKNGFARWYPRFPYERKKEFQSYQNFAENKKVGLWKK